MASWFYAFEGKQEGPFSEAQFRDFLTRGVIRADTLVWSEGMSGWQKASEIPGLLPATGAPAVQPRSGPTRGAAPDASPDTGNSRRATDIGRREFRVGVVLSQAFSAFKARLGTFLLMAFIPSLATFVVVFAGLMLLGFGIMAAGPGRSFGAYIPIAIGSLIAILFFFVVSLGSQAMIAYGTFLNLRGRNFTFGDAFTHTSRRILSILGVALLMVLAAVIFSILGTAVIVGLVALIGSVGASLLGVLITLITFFLATTVLFVTIPACTIEPLGSVASLFRSVELTKGYRWRVFGLILIVLLGTFVAAIAVGLLSAVAQLVGGAVLGVVVNTVFNIFLMAFYSVLPAATYSSLRMAKEGIDVSDITSVFE